MNGLQVLAVVVWFVGIVMLVSTLRWQLRVLALRLKQRELQQLAYQVAVLQGENERLRARLAEFARRAQR